MKYLSSCSFAALTMGLALLGCGGESDVPELGTVSGLVTLDGEPVPHATIQFYPADGGRASHGTSNAGGLFSMDYNAGLSGAQVGTHIVSLTTETAEELEPGIPGYKPGVEEMIPEKYRENSELKVEVNAGDNLIDLTLTK